MSGCVCAAVVAGDRTANGGGKEVREECAGVKACSSPYGWAWVKEWCGGRGGVAVFLDTASIFHFEPVFRWAIFERHGAGRACSG